MLKKQTEPCESTTIKVSFELSHNRFHPQTQKLEPPITEFFKEICLRLNKSSHYERVYMYQTPKMSFFFQTKTLAGLIHVAMEDSVRKLVEALLAIARWDSKERHV